MPDGCAASRRRGAARDSRLAGRADVEHSRRGARAHRRSWSPLAVSGRVAPADVGAPQPPFRGRHHAPAVDLPDLAATLARLLDAPAVLLAAGAFGARAARAAPIAAPPQPRTAATSSSRALQLAREARTRPEPDRRPAAAYVAGLLAGEHEPLHAMRPSDARVVTPRS